MKIYTQFLKISLYKYAYNAKCFVMKATKTLYLIYWNYRQIFPRDLLFWGKFLDKKWCVLSIVKYMIIYQLIVYIWLCIDVVYQMEDNLLHQIELYSIYIHAYIYTYYIYTYSNFEWEANALKIYRGPNKWQNGPNKLIKGSNKWIKGPFNR